MNHDRLYTHILIGIHKYRTNIRLNFLKIKVDIHTTMGILSPPRTSSYYFPVYFFGTYFMKGNLINKYRINKRKRAFSL